MSEFLKGRPTKEQVDSHYRINGELYPQPVYDKYLGNMRRGRASLAGGSVQEFKGFPHDHHDGTTIRAFLDERTTAEMGERIYGPLKELAARLGINIFPTDEILPHITVADLRYQPGVHTDRQGLFNKIRKNSRTIRAIESLQGVTVRFDSLLPGSVFTLAASHLSDEILAVRRSMHEVAQQYAAGEKNLDNIVHVTIGRMGKQSVPAPTRAAYNEFGRAMMAIHHSLVREPILATIDEAKLATNRSFQQKYEQAYGPLMSPEH